MKKIYNWKFILLASFFISLLLLSSVIYADFVALPSESWSKYITLYQSEDTDQTENYYDDIFDVITSENQIFLTFCDSKKINFEMLNLSGEIQKSFSYNLDYDVKKISTALNSDSLSVLIAAENTLKLYKFNLDDFSLLSSFEIADQYELVKLDGQKLVYYNQNKFFYFDGLESHFISENSKTEQFDFKIDQDKLFINLLEYDLGTYYFSFYEYDLITQKMDYHNNIEKIVTISGTTSLDANLYIKNNKIYNCLVLKNAKYGQNFEVYFILDQASLHVLESTNASNMSYDPNTHFVDYKNEVYVAYNDKSFIGKQEVGSQYQSYTNIFMRPVTENQLIDNSPYKILTKSKYYAPNFRFFTLNNYNYLITNEIDHRHNTIYLSSDHPDIISQSKHVKFSDLLDIFFGALTYIPASIMTSWTVIIGLLFPVVFIIIPIAIVKMSWVERNHMKMLYSAVITYILAKIYYVYSDIHLLHFNNKNIGIPPFHLSSPISSILTFVFTTAVSLLCLKLFIKNKPHTHFIASFFFFFLCEMIQYMLYITTYAVMYMNL
ncbi:hypothetical protein [Fusibacter ferrireducens]|uniref:DUF5050 domain-containing protein n=1 Tax=Fusibacter ferrireducens TaxID=2785058 RepID=A0ABR9ZYA0_9FIRM|nr:hypothetical protein [Fusibacter ferrireducens]MBF4695429.1 hypothetical protein [Fusibacter ferrireducens]